MENNLVKSDMSYRGYQPRWDKVPPRKYPKDGRDCKRQGLAKYDLIILDEFGYISSNKEGVEEF